MFLDGYLCVPGTIVENKIYVQQTSYIEIFSLSRFALIDLTSPLAFKKRE
jgi:hypothetical protein